MSQPFKHPTGRLPSLLPVATATTDQAVWSLGSFVTTLLVGRFLGPDGLGLFAIGNAVLFAVATLYNSLVIDPLAYLGPTQFSSKLPRYTGKLLAGTLATSVPVVLVAGSVWFLVSDSSVAVSVLAAIAAGPFVLTGWLARRFPYLKSQPRQALASTVVYFVAMVGGLIAADAAEVMTVPMVFLVMAVAYMLQAAVIVAVFKPSFRGVADSSAWREIRVSHWKYGRWLLSAKVIRWGSDQGYSVLIAALLVNLQVLGGLRAAANFVRTVGLFFDSLGLYFVPSVSAEVAAGDQEPALQTVRGLRWAAAGIALLGVAVATVRGGWILGVLYGPEFEQYGWVLAVLMVGMVFNGSAVADRIGLMAFGHTKGVFQVLTFQAICVLVIGIPLALLFGLAGLVAGVVIGNLAQAAAMAVVLQRRVRMPDEERAGDS